MCTLGFINLQLANADDDDDDRHETHLYIARARWQFCVLLDTVSGKLARRFALYADNWTVVVM